LKVPQGDVEKRGLEMLDMLVEAVLDMEAEMIDASTRRRIGGLLDELVEWVNE
jgi:hypothetical protein